MYLSHPVRRMRDDPMPDATASLVVELDEATADGLRETLDELDGSLEAALGFECYRISLPETAVADLVETSGLARVETADTLSLGVDDDSVKEPRDS